MEDKLLPSLLLALLLCGWRDREGNIAIRNAFTNWCKVKELRAEEC